MDTFVTNVPPVSHRSLGEPPQARLPGEADFDPLLCPPRIDAADRPPLSPPRCSRRRALLATTAALVLLGVAGGFGWHDRARIEHMPIVQRFAHLAAAHRVQAVAVVHHLLKSLPAVTAKPAPKTIAGNNVAPPAVHAQPMAVTAALRERTPATGARPAISQVAPVATPAPPASVHGKVTPTPISGKSAFSSPAAAVVPTSGAAQAELREFTALQPGAPTLPKPGTSTPVAGTPPAVAGSVPMPAAASAGTAIAPHATKPVRASAQPAATPVASPHPTIPASGPDAGLDPARVPASATRATPIVRPSPVARLAPAGARDPVALAVALRPIASTPREQIDLLHLMAKLGIVVRDLRHENAELRRKVGDLTGELNSRMTQFDRRLSLAEAKGAIAAAMGADQLPADPPSATVAAERRGTAPPAKAGNPGAVKVAAVVPPALVRTVKDYRIQAASPGLAMLSSVGLSSGETSSIQVSVGDDVPGVGRIKAIYQKGTRWVVQTDHGLIQ